MTRNNALATAVAAVLLAIAANAYFGVTAYDRTGHAARSNCEEVQDVKRALRAVIAEASKFASTSRVRTAQEKHASTEFYAFAAAELRSRRCT